MIDHSCSGSGQDGGAGKKEISEEISDVGESFKVRKLAGKRQVSAGSVTSGRRSQGIDTKHGPAVRSATPTKPVATMGEIALAETVKAAAMRSTLIPSPSPKLGRREQAVRIETQDLRRKVRSAKVANLVLFVVDSSGSMAARKRMQAVKGAILSLLIDAYQKRDRVGMIAFRGERAEVVLRPTNSVEMAQRRLERLPTGGRTPLAAGLLTAQKLLAQQALRENRVEPLIVVLSDGRANTAVQEGSNPLEEAKLAAGKIAEKGWKSVIIDCEAGYPKLGLARVMAQAMGGECVQLEQLSAESVAGLVQKSLASFHSV